MTISLKKYGAIYFGATQSSEYFPAPTGTVSTINHPYPSSVTLGGRAFATNTSFEPYRREAFRHRTIQPQRQSINFENVAGFGTLNTEGLWRRDQMDWSHGAGQQFLDRKADSNSSRFYKSEGVDVWTENQLSMMKATYSFTRSDKSIAAKNYVFSMINNANGVSITSYSSTTTVATFNFSSYLTWNYISGSGPGVGGNLENGQTVTIADCPTAQFNGTWVISGVTSSSFTVTGTWTATGSTANACTALWDVISYTVDHSNILYMPKSSGYGLIRDIASDGTNVYVATNVGIWLLTTSPIAMTRYVKTGTTTQTTINLLCDGKQNTNTLTSSASGAFSAVAAGMVVTGTGTNSSHFSSNTTVSSVDSAGNTVTLSSPIIVGDLTLAQGVTFVLQQGITCADYKRVWVANDIVLAAASETSVTNANARIMCAFTSKPDPTQTPQANDVLMIHPNGEWNWTSATGGASQIYIGGKVGTDGAVYRSQWSGSNVATSSVAQPFMLQYPISCLPLEGGEYPTCLYAYLNFIFLGTNLGIRMCQTLNQYDPTANGSGDLKAGPLAPNLLQPVTQPVTAIVGHGKFIYFSWSHYLSSLFNLSMAFIGRMDISRNVGGDPLSMAYASDRRYGTNASFSKTVTWIDWDPISDCPLVTHNDESLSTNSSWIPSQASVDSGYALEGEGYMHAGYITYGIADDKIPVKFSAAAYLPTDQNSIETTLQMKSPIGNDFYYNIGVYTGTEIILPGNYRSERIGLTYNILGANTVLYRITLQSWPAVVTETNITPVFMLYRNNQSGPQISYQDPYEALTYLQNLIDTQQIVEYTEGPLKANVVVQGLDWLPHKENNNYEHGFVGDCVVTLKTIGGYSYTPTTTT